MVRVKYCPRGCHRYLNGVGIGCWLLSLEDLGTAKGGGGQSGDPMTHEKTIELPSGALVGPSVHLTRLQSLVLV